MAGAVHFVRKEPEFDTQNTYLNGSVTLGGIKRRDAYFDAMAEWVNMVIYAKSIITPMRAGNYKDGDGNPNLNSSFEAP